MEQAVLFHGSLFDLSAPRDLFELVPSELVVAPCFFDLLTDVWRYEFGAPLSIDGQPLYGTDCWLAVKNLVLVLDRARRYLRPDQLRGYVARLNRSEREQHTATLAEFLPVLTLSDNTRCEFEFRTGEGARDVDWRLLHPGSPSLLVEVKRRTKDLVELMQRVYQGERRQNGHAPRPEHDARLLFKSIEKKYPLTEPGGGWQGAWICTALEQDVPDMLEAFGELSPSRVQFVVLGGFSGPIDVIARGDVEPSEVARVLGRELRRSWTI